jgi:hypothetical protein
MGEPNGGGVSSTETFPSLGYPYSPFSSRVYRILVAVRIGVEERISQTKRVKIDVSGVGQEG